MSTLTAEEVAEMFWRCIESQRNLCFPWDTFRRVPYELQKIAPLERKIVYRSPEPGVRLMSTIRLFSAEKAEMLCSTVGFNLIEQLALGYDHAKRRFIQCIKDWYMNTKILNYYH